ncbi:MAG: hypothetical protein EOP34_07915 [Rickettsiales bacterium]|nr:MAG: hypothetical protein EOP34_07915 [Rickettsiales bacterium]
MDNKNDVNNNDSKAIDHVKEFSTITLRLSAKIKKEFKMWCVQNDVDMNDAFARAFNLLKEKGL